MPIVPDKYRKAGIYGTDNINSLGRGINNFESGDGITINRNPVGGIQISNSTSSILHPFKIYDFSRSADNFVTPASVKVYSGYWWRGWAQNALVCDTDQDYKTLTFSSSGTYVVYIRLLDPWSNPSGDSTGNGINVYAEKNINPSGIYGSAPEWSRQIRGDFSKSITTIGFITVLDDGTLGHIDQQITDDVSDEIEYKPLGLRNIICKSNTNPSTFTTVWGGDWYTTGSNVASLTLTDATNNYASITTDNVGPWTIYVELDTGVSPATLELKASNVTAANLAADSSTTRVIAEYTLASYWYGHRINSVADVRIHYCGGDIYGGSSLPAVRAQYDVITSLDGSTWVSDVIRFHA